MGTHTQCMVLVRRVHVFKNDFESNSIIIIETTSPKLYRYLKNLEIFVHIVDV